jgi:hypothetical protein
MLQQPSLRVPEKTHDLAPDTAQLPLTQQSFDESDLTL